MDTFKCMTVPVHTLARLNRLGSLMIGRTSTNRGYTDRLKHI